MIRFTEKSRVKMLGIGERGYPHEICGMLLGKAGDLRLVSEIFECGNLNKMKPETRYDMDPKDYMKESASASRDARSRPVPMTASVMGRSRTSASAERSTSSPFSRESRPTHPIT